MRKTKIICTLGPSTDDPAVLRELMLSGMDVARINMSHQDHDAHRARIDRVRALREELRLPIAILIDTKGPEIRLGTFPEKVTLKAGDTFTLTTVPAEGTAERASISFAGLPGDVDKGSHILIDDGLIDLIVEKTTDTDIVCTVLNGGTVSSNKGINVPGAALSMPFMSERDKADIAFACEMEADFIAASFTRRASDVLQVRQELEQHQNHSIRIIAKIENAEGVDNIDDILKVSDGIMVARGDMGVEISLEEIPSIQKTLIHKGYNAGLQVITATQMLDSMIRNPRPTRAEVTDVANAVYDGTDAVMLSGETAQGKYPVEALQMMVHIVENTEKHLDYDLILKQAEEHRMKSVSSALAHATVTTAGNLGAKCIIAPSMSGATSRVVSKFKPKTEIIGVSPNERTLRRMQIYWGVRPLKSIQVYTTEDICNSAIELICAKQLAETGDVVVLTAGIPSPHVAGAGTGFSNMMRIAVVE